MTVKVMFIINVSFLQLSFLGDALNVNFPYHNPNFPAISEMMYNPFTYVGNGTSIGGKSAFEKRMIRAHGTIYCPVYLRY